MSPISARDRYPAFADPDDYRRARAVLDQAGFTVAGICTALGIGDTQAISSREIELLHYRTRHGRPLDVLFRLFFMDEPMSEELARQAVTPMSLESWIAAGLLGIKEGAVAAEMRLLPFGDMVLALDPPWRLASDLAAQYVMGIGRSSLTLANITVRRPSELTLDLGACCGFQAFLAA